MAVAASIQMTEASGVWGLLELYLLLNPVRAMVVFAEILQG